MTYFNQFVSMLCKNLRVLFHFSFITILSSFNENQKRHVSFKERIRDMIDNSLSQLATQVLCFPSHVIDGFVKRFTYIFSTSLKIYIPINDKMYYNLEQLKSICIIKMVYFNALLYLSYKNIYIFYKKHVTISKEGNLSIK